MTGRMARASALRVTLMVLALGSLVMGTGTAGAQETADQQTSDWPPPDALGGEPADTSGFHTPALDLRVHGPQPAGPDTLLLPHAEPDTAAAAAEKMSSGGGTYDPRAIRLQVAPYADGEFVRPWATQDRWRRRGLGLSRVVVPASDVRTARFERAVSVDARREYVVVRTVAAGISFVSFAAPLEEYSRLSSEAELSSRWKDTVLADLGRETEKDGRGILDIDIPMPLPGPFADAIGPGANLKVRGSERITFGGQTSYVVEALDQESAPPSRWPQLDMQQHLTVNLEGTIGRKIHVYVDHRSGGDSFGASKANQIRVHYDGDEDEIIQKIELGEVNLSLPGTEFVSYSGRHEGLFGAKMTAKVGKLDLVSIASKEEGKSSSASFTGTSESDSLAITDLSFKGRTFFVVDGEAFKWGDVAIKTIDVYIDDRNGANDIETSAQPGRAYLEDPVGGVPPGSGPSQRGVFDGPLTPLEDYLIDYETGVLEFLSPVPSSSVLAVSYSRFDGYTVGGSHDDTLRLKMIKKDDRVGGTVWEPTRLYELKNVYDLGAREIPEDGFRLKIKKRAASGEVLDTQDGVPYIRILGLDTHGLGGALGSDGLVDLEWIDFEKGYLFFPHVTPFCPDYDTTSFYYPPEGGPDPIYVADELEPANCAAYSEEDFDADDDIYFLEVGYNRPQTTFYLGSMNIIENSEIVRLNGVRLTRGVDYTIYYPSGQLTLLTEEAKEPDARVTVDFDYKPFGFGGEKTLLGTRGVYNWSENISLGTTWMYQSKGTPEDRPRLGEEPSRTVVGDVNLSGDFTPDFLTWLADAIPLVDTDVESSLRVSAEAAVCVPDPNTKGFVSVDDMEGAQDVSMLGVSRRLWVESSVPEEPPGVSAGDRMAIDWYNPDRKVREGDLHPDLPSQEADDIHPVLEIDHESEGSYSWAGLMRLLSKTGNDYSDYQFLEVWVNDSGYRQGAVSVDLGTISEDFYPLNDPNGILDTEDLDKNGFDSDENTGLDNVAGDDADNVPGDDGDDDYEYSYGSDDYARINGTEGNEGLDTEDLNGNWYLDTDNKYWNITFDLSDTTYLVQDNSGVVAGNHWRLYRVPLGDALSVNGIADWTVIKSARLVVQDLPPGADPIMIGSIDIVGTQWEPAGIRDAFGKIIPEDQLVDESFGVDTKNTKEDIDYTPPFDPGVDEETNLPKREQALVLRYENLESGHSGSARKLFYSDEDYTSYQALELYVHGASNIEAGTVFFLRMGADTSNYYEYSLEVVPGWLQDSSSDRNRLSIPLDALTNLKLYPHEGNDTAAAWGDTAHVKRERFRRVGWPSLSKVRRLTIGVKNGNEEAITSTISGEVWVDDIRLTDVRKEIGWAQRATVAAKVADLAKLNFDLRHRDSEFHTLKQSRGSGQDNLSYNVSGTLNADRFVSGLGISTPIGVSWKRSTTRPKFSTGSDIVLDAVQSDKEKTETLNRSVSVAFSRKRQSSNFLTHVLLDGLTLRASASDNQRLTPSRADTTTTLRGRIGYRYSPEKRGLRVFRNTRIYLLPTNFRFSIDTYLTHNLGYDITQGVKKKRTNNRDKKLTAGASVDFQLLDNLGTSHSVSAERDLSQINRFWGNVNIGKELDRKYSNSLNFSPKFGKWLSPKYSFSSSFTDNHGPEVRRVGDPAGIRNIRAQNNQQLRASLDLKKLLGLERGAPKGGGGGRDRRRSQVSGAGAQGEGGDDGEESEEPEATPEAQPEPEAAGPGFEALLDPVLNLLRNMDAIEGTYGLKRSSKYDRITANELPGWTYRLGLSRGLGADERNQERTLDLGTGVKVTSAVRIKGGYRRVINTRTSRNDVAGGVVVNQTEAKTEVADASLSWSGVESIGPLERVFKTVRLKSGAEYKRSHSGPAHDPSHRGNMLAFDPIVLVDATWKNGLSTSFSIDRRRARDFSLAGAGSVTENVTGNTSVRVNYRFSAPQGLKLPFFGQKLKFQSNLDCSLTLRTSSKDTRTALDEASLVGVDPTASTREFSVVGDATYSFSRNVSGGLRVSFAQDRDQKRDRTRRTIGVHLTAEFKF